MKRRKARQAGQEAGDALYEADEPAEAAPEPELIRHNENVAPLHGREQVYENTRDSIGPLLRQTRESFGYDLQRISQALRVRYIYLEAIEQGAFDRLPGPAYAVGFIRSYADFLGLDSEQVVDFYKRDSSTPRAQPSYYLPEPKTEAKLPGAAIFLVCLVLAAVAYGSWHFATQSDSSVADYIPEVPERLKVLLEPEEAEVEEVIAEVINEPASAPNVSLPDDAEPVPEEEAVDAVAPEASTEPGAEVAAAPATDAPESGEVAAEEAPQPAGQESGEDSTAVDDEPVAENGDTALADDLTSAFLESAPAAEEGPIVDEPAVVPLDPHAEDEISALIEAMVGEEAAAASEAEAVTLAPENSDTAASNGETLVAPASEDTLLAEALAAQAGIAEEAPPAIPAVPGSDDDAGPDLAPEPQVYGEASDEVRVILRAVEDCWVQVRAEDGNLLLSRVLRPGDVYRVPLEDNLTLLAGNAGGLEVLVDGRLLPPLGLRGVVRRDVSLNVDALLGATANLQ